MKIAQFTSFDQPTAGRTITAAYGYTVVDCTNPYGGTNLVLVDTGQAIRHGNGATLAFARQHLGRHAYRRTIKHLYRVGALLLLRMYQNCA